MKKSLTFLGLVLALGFLTTACSSKTSNVQNNNNETDKNAMASGTPRRGDAPHMPDFGQPDRAQDIMGVVKSIVGNQVTILKIDRPTRGTNAQGTASSTEQKKTATLSLGGATTGQAGGRQGGGMRPPMGGENGGTVDRAAMLENLKKQSTGEVVVTIPIGIKMLIADSTNAATPGAEQKMNEATLIDIKQDKMLSIWLNQDVKDQSVAEFVFVR